MSVYKAINAVQAALSKTGIAKDRTNTQGAGFKFRGIDDVYNAVAPLLAEHGLVIIPRMLARSCEDRQSKAGAALFYVTVEAEFDFVCAEDGSKATARTFGEAMDSGDKATNKAMSAAYKYACFQTFAIPTEGDNDADAHTHQIAATKPAATTKTRPTSTPAKPAGKLDMSPQARAMRIVSGVATGDAAGAATAMAGWDDETRDAVWELLDIKTQEQLTAAWPKETA